jgi:hypothetical protein
MLNYVYDLVKSTTNLVGGDQPSGSSDQDQGEHERRTLPPETIAAGFKHDYRAFLVMDVEGTCELGTDYDWPNEIIVNHLPYS